MSNGLIKTVTFEETRDLLAELIRTNSENPAGRTEKCAVVLMETLEAEGIDCEIKESKPGIHNIVARLKGKRTDESGGKRLLFNGHIDTVPAGEGWSVDPFGAEIKDGYMYGRGSTDMKAGIASSLMALVEAKREGANFNGEIIFTAVGDEEYHSLYGTKWLLSNGLAADFAVNCEPTNLDICLGNRGLLMVDVIVKGRSSHGGRPNLGRNAVSLASSIIKELESIDFEGSRDDNFKDPLGSLSIVGIHGGDRINVIPDRCVFHIDRRLMPNEMSQTAINQIENAILKVTGNKPSYKEENGAEVIIKPEVWHEPFWMNPEGEYIAGCIDVFREVFHREPVFEGKSAGTDASHLVAMGNIPTLIFGPGDYRASHTIDEKVELSQLLKATEYYNRLIENILK